MPERSGHLLECIRMRITAEVEYKTVNESEVSSPVQILMKKAKIEDFLKNLKNLRINCELCLESFRIVLEEFLARYDSKFDSKFTGKSKINDFLNYPEID